MFVRGKHIKKWDPLVYVLYIVFRKTREWVKGVPMFLGLVGPLCRYR